MGKDLPSEADLLFAKIALGKGYCSQSDVDRCLAMQMTNAGGLPLGQILLHEGCLTEERYSEILALEEKTLAVATRFMKRRKESILFGKLVIREGLLTEGEVANCLRIQAEEQAKRSLGEIMVSINYLTAAQVKSLLAKQQKKIMSCPKCQLSFTVLTISRGKKIKCPRCKGPLVDGKPSDSVRTDAEITTQFLQVVRSEIPSHAPPGSGSPSTANKVDCIVCRQSFNAVIDSTGKVQCPSCYATFLPR